VLRVNLRGAFLTTKYSLKLMMRQRYGRIVYVSSVVAGTGNTGQASYAASKAGMTGLSQSVAQEYASYNVRTVVVAPGLLDAGLGATLTPQHQRRMADRSLCGLGDGAQVADTIAFLTTPAANYINATTIHVDGGVRYS
jgi:3-oxoacyl-[acyl-carrier protein] reductase